TSPDPRRAVPAPTVPTAPRTAAPPPPAPRCRPPWPAVQRAGRGDRYRADQQRIRTIRENHDAPPLYPPSTATTRPVSKVEPVSPNTSNGNATFVSAEPACEMVLADQYIR